MNDVGVVDYTGPGLPTQSPLAPTTTAQEDVTTAGQRKINNLWEYTQAIIALLVVTTTMVSGVIEGFKNVPVPTIISVAFGTVIGFYFARTNHAAIGGVGAKPNPKYEGR